MIGGVQRYTAIMRINKQSGRKILVRKCAVYGRGLTRQAALVLARQHNEFNQIQRTTSFPEIAASCRRLLFAHFSGENDDDGTAELSIPRYNSQPYRCFKQECLTFLVSSQTVSEIPFNYAFIIVVSSIESVNGGAGNPNGNSYD